jgi:mono/diheme cytochrome c family protein
MEARHLDMNRPLLVLAAGLLGACAPERWDPDALSRGSGSTSDEELALGKETYDTYCSGCHGLAGDGNGPAARHLDPKPRDLRVGILKFASVPSGQPPHDDDYLRVITHGLDGTAMPSFRLVPEEERRALVAYVRTFVTAPDPKGPGEPVVIGRDPYRTKPEKGVALGERLYHGLAECSSCHPAYATREAILQFRRSFDMTSTEFRDNMYASEAKPSDWGAPITPPDFLYDRVKTGTDRENLTRVIAAGIGGTAMPNWSGSLDGKQLWALAYYVETLASRRATPEGRALRAALEAQP